MDMNEWIRTDDYQWCRKIDSVHYDLIEVRLFSPDNYVVVTGEIDLYDYIEDDVLDIVQGYGYESFDEINKQYGDDAGQIICECVFEQTNEKELTTFGPFNSEEEAEQYALTIIR